MFINGVVEAVGTGKTGKTKYIKVGGTFYSYFADKGGNVPQLNKGDSVEFQASQRGDFWNLDPNTVKVVGAATSAPPPETKSYSRASPAGGLEGAIKGKTVDQVRDMVMALPYKEGTALRLASNEGMAIGNAINAATQLTVAMVEKGMLKVDSTDVTDYMLAQAGVVARKALSGELVKVDDFVEEPTTQEPVKHELDDEIAF